MTTLPSKELVPIHPPWHGACSLHCLASLVFDVAEREATYLGSRHFDFCSGGILRWLYTVQEFWVWTPTQPLTAVWLMQVLGLSKTQCLHLSSGNNVFSWVSASFKVKSKSIKAKFILSALICWAHILYISSYFIGSLWEFKELLLPEYLAHHRCFMIIVLFHKIAKPSF